MDHGFIQFLYFDCMYRPVSCSWFAYCPHYFYYLYSTNLPRQLKIDAFAKYDNLLSFSIGRDVLLDFYVGKKPHLQTHTQGSRNHCPAKLTQSPFTR